MGTSPTFQQVLIEFAPLFGLSFSIYALKGFRISHSTHWVGGIFTHLLDVVLSSAVGAFLIVGVCIVIKAVSPQINEAMIVGLAAFMSVGGVSVVDKITHKYLGIRLLDPDVKVRGEINEGTRGEIQ